MLNAIKVTAIAGLVFSGIWVSSLFSHTSEDDSMTNKNTNVIAVEQDKPLTQQEIKDLSEAFGHFIGRNLKAPGITFDLEAIIRGMREGAEGKKAPMSDQEYEKMMGRLQMMAFRQLSQENLKAANEFLEKNKEEGDVHSLEGGKLQYKVLKEGKGEAVKEHNSPQVEYVGKYIDGTVFGSSKDTGGPIVIPLDQTIPGFSKGLLGMKEGEKRMIFVHPDLGYGSSGQLPPNSLLIFEVELVKPHVAKDEATLSNEHDSDEDSSSDEDDDDDDYSNDSHEHSNLKTRKL